MEWLILNARSIGGVLEEEVMHFALSALAGLLVYFVILTTSRVSLKRWHPKDLQRYLAVSRFIRVMAGLACVSVALLSHYGLDAFVSWWHAPINPPLVILP